MYEQLPILLQLQELDNEISKLERKKARVPVELQALEAELEEFRAEFQAQTDKLEELQKERRSKDRQLSTQQAQLEKYRSQRLSIKTNKEYTALESEIANVEIINSGVEDEILEVMISIDESADKIESAKDKLKAQEKIFKAKKRKLLSEVRKLDRQIAEQSEERGTFIKKIDAALLRRYDNWRKRRGGSLVAVIMGPSCGGCHLKLPPQLINEVRKKDRFHTCNSCGRILYWKREVVEPEPVEETNADPAG